MTPHRTAALWLALNGLAAVAYLRLASLAWVEPELAAIPEAHGGGAAVVWALGALPFFLACMGLNLSGLAWAARGRLRHTSRLAWLVPAVWLAALVIDFSRH